MAGKKSVPLYLKLLESGSEKKRDIRLVIVGKNGAGKTSLIKRLFSEENTDVTSTNGIEIHTIKCKAMSDDGIWNKLDGTTEETEIHARLLKQYKKTIEASLEPSVEEGTHKDIRENTSLTSFEESKESEKVAWQPKLMTPSVTIESLVEHPATSQQRSPLYEQAEQDIEAMLKSNVDLHDEEEYATFLLWDFAGDKEFYHTHQTFLSPDAIYLVVTKLNEADDKSAQEMFQLWMNSIHCYCRPKSNNEEMQRKENDDYIYPPVVLVGSHKDKVVLTKGEEIEDRCRACLDRYVQNVSEDARRHLSKEYEYFISNTEDDSGVFKKIRQNLLNLAKTMKTWNMDYPLKFIQLEKCLQQRKKKLPIIQFRELKDISSETQKPLSHKELKFFLEFHHEMRTLVYFEDLSDYIILDTQWLSNAFKCIITAKKFQSDPSRHLVKDKWDDLNVRGLLHSVVLENILDRNKNIFEFEEEEQSNDEQDKHKDHILKVMEKFDIIIRPKTSNQVAADEKPLYYVPCMVKAVPEKDIYEMFNVTKNTCRISTWLCFQFSFLPPHLMNHLIASLSRNYEVAEVGVTRQEQSKIALFKNIAVFELQKNTKLTKLLVMTFRNIIQIQVWDFEAEIKAGQFKFIADYMTLEINKIIHTRFKMSTVGFSKKWDCGFKKPGCMTESRNFDIVGKYYCTTCLETHTFTDEWSNQPKPLKSSEVASGFKPDTETTSPTQIISENKRVWTINQQS
ncbi:probable serine/threonine-protein kinase roco8 [Mytilus edulis]|uniref:probable serine/threonine-protein kinase roco8 n=1 Tax=Mytilus edulis TaxID=6550 RepID=UPI0039EF7DA3